MPRRRKLFLAAAVMLIVVGVLAAVCAWLHFNSLEARFAKLRVGMTRDEVRAIMGPPVSPEKGMSIHVQRPYQDLGVVAHTDNWGEAQEGGAMPFRDCCWVDYDAKHRVVRKVWWEGVNTTLWDRIRDWWSGPPVQSVSPLSVNKVIETSPSKSAFPF